ncbi:MAG TPA: sugar phosphate isomerase/epimerase family protein [Draconibacterium sp.]|nr:sugar phosphate isomerase/epimerase family protein [Draconibacterium sp.]
MKLSYTYATPDTKSTSMLAYRGDAEKTFSKLKSLGYQAVEFMVRDSKKLDIVRIKTALDNSGLVLCAVSTGQLRAEDDMNLSDLNESNRKETVKRTRDVIDFASGFGVQINIGSLRGKLPENREAALNKATESLSELLDHALDCGINIALEPQNRYTINWLNNIEETLDFCSHFSQSNLKLVFDVYHWLLEEKSIYASLIKAWNRITHIQFSDSNRSWPGSGQINFPDLIRVLNALNYDGFISVEAKQAPSSEYVARRSADYLLPLLNEKN